MIKIEDMTVSKELDVSEMTAVRAGFSFGASSPPDVGGRGLGASSPAVDDSNAPVKESVSFSYAALVYSYS